MGEDAVRRVGREEQLGRALEGRDELTLVAPAHLDDVGVQRRDHALVAVRVERHHRATTVEGGGHGLTVDRAGVVHLEEALGQDLPVAAHRHRLGVDHPHGCRRQLLEHRRERLQPVEQGHGVVVEVDEVPPAPSLAAHRRQAALLLLQPDEVALVGHPHEVAAEVVAPRVVLAHEHAGRPALPPHDGSAPVAAGVVEGPDRPRRRPGRAAPARRRCRRACSCPASGARSRGPRTATPSSRGARARARRTPGRCSGRGEGRAASGSRPAARSRASS